MGAKKLPDYRLKQKLLYVDKTAAETLARYGDAYYEVQAFSDALEFYIKAANQEGMRKIQDIAQKEGDVFLFQACLKALGKDISAADWEAIGRRAQEFGKYAFAQHALEKSNNTELLKALAAKMKAEETSKDA